LPPRPEDSARQVASGPNPRRARGWRGETACAGAARFVAVTTIAVASLTRAHPAVAQVGLGAERYEVTITPPKRPGTEKAVDEAAMPAPASKAAPKPAAAGTADGVLGAGKANETPGAVAAPGASGSKPAASASGAKPAASPPVATASAKAEVDPSLPQRTLQVGAFRQRDRAQSMRDKLAASFPDVTIVEVQSGGETLYRIYVGRMPRGASLDELRRRVVAAGYPAFDVTAPPVSADD